MLWDKGVQEFVNAAVVLRSSYHTARFVLVGSPDAGNPRSVPRAQLETWQRDGIVEWWGPRKDMPQVLSAASVFVLPTTYPEGTPKVLLEAAACSRPIVATDAPGCREIVRSGVNGLLVPPRDHPALVRAIEQLLDDPRLRATFGQAGRDIAVREFREELVIEQMMDVYRDLLVGRWVSRPR
jgi:glycosyltransferase involved in cell wall biosynthesis